MKKYLLTVFIAFLTLTVTAMLLITIRTSPLASVPVLHGQMPTVLITSQEVVAIPIPCHPISQERSLS